MLKQKIIFIPLIILLAAQSAHALNPCTSQSPSGNYLIYVDPVTFASAGSNKEIFSDRLRFAVLANVQELHQKLFYDRSRNPRMPMVDVVPCDKQRSPQQISDFTAIELHSLDQSRVMLELWSVVIDPPSGRGQVGYTLVSANSQKVADPAIYTVNRVLGSTPQTIIKAFEKDSLLIAYATIAVGTRLYQNKEYTSSAAYLCNGAVKLSKVISKEYVSPDTQLFIAEQRGLLNGVIGLRSQALQQSGTDPSPDPACPLVKLP